MRFCGGSFLQERGGVSTRDISALGLLPVLSQRSRSHWDSAGSSGLVASRSGDGVWRGRGAAVPRVPSSCPRTRWEPNGAVGRGC